MVIIMKKSETKKGILGMVAGICLMLLLTACGAQALPEQFDEDTVQAEAETAIAYFNERDYQSIIDMGSDEFKEVITVENFLSQSEPYLEKCGEYKELSKTVFVGNVDKKTQKAFGGVIMVGTYEKGTIQFTIGFDEEMQLVQFYIK